MPAKKPSTSRKRTNRSSQLTPKAKAVHHVKTKKNSKMLLIMCAVIAGLILTYVTFTVLSQKIYNDTEKEKMTTYLEDKYGQKFTVNNLRVTGGGFGVEGRLTADANPTTDPSIVFSIGKPEYSKAASYTQDTFLQTLWSQQEHANVRSYMTDTLGDVSSYQVNIRLGDEMHASIHGHTPSFNEAQRKYPEQYSYELIVDSATHATNSEPSINELSRAFQLVEMARSKRGSPYTDIYYHYDNYIISTAGKGIKNIQKPEDLSFKKRN